MVSSFTDEYNLDDSWLDEQQIVSDKKDDDVEGK